MKEIDTDLENHLPKYYQLARIIKRKIEEGKFFPGTPLPSIPSLMKNYQVSQNTVRQAVATLIKEKVIYTDHGRGTFVRTDYDVKEKSGLIGALFPDLNEPSIFAGVTTAMEKEIYKEGDSLLLGHTDNDYSKAKNYIRLYKEKKIDGLIVVPLQGEKYEELNLSLLRQIEKESLPYILIDCYLDRYPTDAVVTNNEEMGYLLTKHLLEQGYSRIAFIAGPYGSSMRDRLKGYQKALKEIGISYDENLVFFSKGRFQKDAYTLAKRVLTKSARPNGWTQANLIFRPMPGSASFMSWQQRSIAGKSTEPNCLI